MPSERRQRRSHRHDPTASSEAGPSRPKARPMEERDPAGLPGISKLKASIRSTKRLLAKDKIEPGFKVTTERRLIALEADLAKAEKRDVEKKNGGKYHMVKFFERQKIQRIIKRLKKTIAGEGKESKKQKSIQQLEDARVMLNYILHFPNESKYISLFPPSTDGEEKAEDKPRSKLPALLPAKGVVPDMRDLPKGDKKRLEVLLNIRDLMEKGQLSRAPDEDETREKAVVDFNDKVQDEKPAKRAKAEADNGDEFFDSD